MAWFLQMTGCFIIINYASLIFQESSSVLDPHISSIVLAAVQIIGGVISTSLSDSFGRKIILIISIFGSGIGLFSTSLYLYFCQIGFDLSNYSVLPVICLSFVIFISSAGVAPLSNVCTVENLPPKVIILWIHIISTFLFSMKENSFVIVSFFVYRFVQPVWFFILFGIILWHFWEINIFPFYWISLNYMDV